jgi:hypothetical protein
MDEAMRKMFAEILALFLQAGLVTLVGLAGWAAQWAAQKFKRETTAQQQDTLQKVAREAMYYAQEWAARQTRPLTGEEKRSLALGFMKRMLPELAKGDKGILLADRALHAQLGATLGMGASKDVGVPAAPASK